MFGHPTPRWQAEPTLNWVHFPDATEWVAYHPLAGTVHCLTDAAHEIWVAASDRPRSAEELVTLVRPRFEEITAADLEQVVSDTLASMDRAGLLVPARP